MNPRLRALLDLAGVTASSELPLRWGDLVLVNNVGAIPPGRDEPGDYRWNRGFNFLLLDRGGRPVHFCKCRYPGVDALAHETRTLQELSSDEALARHIPATRGAQTDGLLIQVSRFLSGTTLSSELAELPEPDFERTLLDTIAAATLVSRRAPVCLSHLFAGGERVDPAAEARPHLDYLAGVGLEEPVVRALADSLSGVPLLPRVLQHGDLWAGNVVRFDGSLWLLDFEIFGRVQVPLYDAAHFLRTAGDRRVRRDAATCPWIERIAGTDPQARLVRRGLREAARAFDLTDEQLAAAVIYYGIDFASRIRQRGASRTFWEPPFLDVQGLGHRLHQGLELPRLLSRP